MQGYQMSRGGNGPVGMTSLNATIADSASHTVLLTGQSNQVKISNYSPAHILYISFYGPAANTNYAIPPLWTLEYDGPAITQLFLNSNNQSINYGVLAI